MTNNIFLYFIVFIGIFLSSIAGLYSISGLVIIFKGNIIATTLMAVALEISKVCISIYIHVFWKKANKLLLTYLTFALLVLMLITSAGVYSYLSKSYMTSTDTDVIYEKIKLIESQIEIEKEKIKSKQEEVKGLRNYPQEKRDNGYYWKINAINAKITEYTNNIEKMTDGITPLRNKVLEINMEIGPLKYISLFLYQSEGKAAIDKSVQVFIGIVVMVFDPLAILLIFSGIHGLHKRRIEIEQIEKEIFEKRERERERRLILKEEKIKNQAKISEIKIINDNKILKEENKRENQTIELLEEKINESIQENVKTIKEDLQDMINIISPKNIKDEDLPLIPPPVDEQRPIKIKEEKKVLKIKKLEEKPKKEKIIINEKEIIPPLIKNRPKKNKNQEFKESKENKEFKEEIKVEIEQIIQTDKPKKENRAMKINRLKDVIIDDKNLLEEEFEKIREQMMDKEKAMDFLYNGERQEEYLIKRTKNKKNKT
jgi:hypothetical protein